MKVECIRDPESLEKLKDLWNELLFSSEQNCIFLTHEWISSWWKCFSEDNSLEILIFKDEEGLAIGGRRQTVSTSGLSNKIDKLGEMDLGVHIAISLHAVDDELRTELIPMNKAHNINSIIEAVKRFPIDTRKRVMFEYLVIKNKNDDIGSAKKLVKLLTGIKAKVNLIYFNPYPESVYDRPTRADMVAFQEYLVNHGLLCTIRDSKGIDISAACGQLKEKTEGEQS